MTGDRPVRLANAAIARHHAASDAATARIDRAVRAADQTEALRLIEALMTEFGRFIGEDRRLPLLRQRANAT